MEDSYQQNLNLPSTDLVVFIASENSSSSSSSLSKIISSTHSSRNPSSFTNSFQLNNLLSPSLSRPINLISLPLPSKQNKNNKKKILLLLLIKRLIILILAILISFISTTISAISNLLFNLTKSGITLISSLLVVVVGGGGGNDKEVLIVEPRFRLLRPNIRIKPSRISREGMEINRSHSNDSFLLEGITEKSFLTISTASSQIGNNNYNNQYNYSHSSHSILLMGNQKLNKFNLTTLSEEEEEEGEEIEEQNFLINEVPDLIRNNSSSGSEEEEEDEEEEGSEISTLDELDISLNNSLKSRKCRLVGVRGKILNNAGSRRRKWSWSTTSSSNSNSYKNSNEETIFMSTSNPTNIFIKKSNLEEEILPSTIPISSTTTNSIKIIKKIIKKPSIITTIQSKLTRNGSNSNSKSRSNSPVSSSIEKESPGILRRKEEGREKIDSSGKSSLALEIF